MSHDKASFDSSRFESNIFAYKINANTFLLNTQSILHTIVWLFLLAYGIAFGVRSASAANSSLMNAAGLGGLGSVPSPSSLYSINNMAASLLAQSKLFAKPTESMQSHQTPAKLLSFIKNHMYISNWLFIDSNFPLAILFAPTKLHIFMICFKSPTDINRLFFKNL